MDTTTPIANKDSIFHYATYEKAVNILLEKRLRFSNLKTMDDPREKSWKVDFYSEDHTIADRGEKPFEVMNDLTEKINLHYKVACFCRNKYSRSIYCQPVSTTMLGYARLRMWSQYADKHAGVCIVFSISEMKEALRLQHGKQKFFGKGVGYKRDFYSDYQITGINNNALTNPDEHINKHRDRIFFTKYIDYKDENEYRFVVHDPQQKFEGVDIAQCIKAIILWEHAGEDRYSQLKNLCNCNKLNNVKFYKARWATGNGPDIIAL